MGRPPKSPDDKRSHGLPRLRVTLPERVQIEGGAAVLGMTISEYIRSMVLTAKVPPKRPAQWGVDHLAALQPIGKRLNEIARRAHVTGDIDDDFPTVLEEIQTLLAAIAADPPDWPPPPEMDEAERRDGMTTAEMFDDNF